MRLIGGVLRISWPKAKLLALRCRGPFGVDPRLWGLLDTAHNKEYTRIPTV